MNREIKKAILVVSFGTSYENTRKLTIDKIEELIKDKFKAYEIRRAFTAHGVIRKLKEKHGIFIDTPEEALKKLKDEGFEEIVIQPLHLIPGLEYDYIKNVVETFKREGGFKNISLGRPALFFKGEEEDIPDDYSIFAEALRDQIPKDKSVILMGHGTHHPANAVYSCLQCVLRDKGIDNAFIGTIDGYPSLSHIIDSLNKKSIEEVILMPLLLVSGDHAINDMAGEDKESWKSILEREGFKVDTYMHGLGENHKIQDIYIQHLIDAIENRYANIGRTKKGVR